MNSTDFPKDWKWNADSFCDILFLLRRVVMFISERSMKFLVKKKDFIEFRGTVMEFGLHISLPWMAFPRSRLSQR